jgi:hypothetical protein
MLTARDGSGGAPAVEGPETEPHAKVGKQTTTEGVANQHPGGNDALGRKEDKVAPYFQDMVDVAKSLAPQFTRLGMKFRPEIVLATVLQEASATNPVGDISFDDGLGLMQITPYHGQLDAPVAKVLDWDNSKTVQYNIAHSKWKNAHANLQAGGDTLLDKAQAIKGGVPHTWSEMTDAQRWRATMFAYNAGQGSAIKALETGGPNARMISTFTVNGQTESHDYTAELNQKLDYVDKHDPFGKSSAKPGGDGPSPTMPPKKPTGKPPASNAPKNYRAAPSLADVAAGRGVIEIGMAGTSVEYVQQHVDASVDREFGPITQSKVREYQSKKELEVDGVVGEHTLAAMHGKGTTTSKKGSGGKGKGGKGPPKGGSAVEIAGRFVGDESWSPKLRDDIGGHDWHYDNAGRVTNNCAEFVSSVLRMAGEISFQDAGVLDFESKLRGAGWKYRRGKAESQPGDVWIHEYNPQHTVLIASAGGGETLGSDGSATEIIKREPMPYPGAKYMYKG